MRREAGYVASIALLFIVFLGFLWAIHWHLRRQVQTELLQEQLTARLEQELPREIQNLYARARAAGSVPDRQLIEARAFINLHDRGRREMVELERQRQHMKHLMAERVEVRAQLSRLSLEVRRAQMWVMMLERRLQSLPLVEKTGKTRWLPPIDAGVPGMTAAAA